MSHYKSSDRKTIALVTACLVCAFASSFLLGTEPQKSPPAPTTTAPATTATAPSSKAKTPAEREAFALKFHQEYLPEIYSSILIIKQKDEKKYNDQYKNPMIDETKRLVDMRERGSKYFEPTVMERRLDFRSKQLTKDLRTPELLTSVEVTQKSQELKKVLADLFDVRNTIRGYQLDDTAESLERERKFLAEKVANKDKEIERQLKTLNLPPVP